MKTTTYTVELAPVHTENRKERNEKVVITTVISHNHATAVAMASEQAKKQTELTGIEYGVVRVY